MIVEDFERILELDQMYLVESKMREEEEHRQWEDEHSEHQLPAKVEILMPKLNEVQSDSLPF